MFSKKILSIITVILLFSSLNAGFCQSSRIKGSLKMAEKEYKNLRFLSTIKYLETVVAQDSSILKVQEMMAYSHRNLRNYDEALRWFAKLSKNPALKPAWALHYAEALANRQHYEQSENWYRRYLKMVPSDKRANSFIKSSVFSSQDNAEWKVIPTKLNSPASEYSPVFYNDGLIFCSNLLQTKIPAPVFGWDQTPYSNLYYVKSLDEISGGDSSSVARASKKASYTFNNDDTAPTSNDSRTIGQLSTVWLRNEAEAAKSSLDIRQVPGAVNSKFNEGPGVILPEGSLIFTRNNFKGLFPGKSANGTIKLKMYVASGAKWSKIDEFPFNSDEYSVGHPAISTDGNVLVFASDKPGGFGGVDLYYSVRSGEGKKWSRPYNMGARINTEGDEMFPSFGNENVLFFSSTGYAGYGGLDIFEVTLKDLKPTSVPKNLGAPINSFGDDFGMIRSADNRSGYFSSNRSGSDDIYEYRRQNYHVKLKGLIVDAKTKIATPGSQVFLRHANGIDTLVVNRKGEFGKELNKETDYEVIGYNPDFITKRAFITTSGIDVDSTISVVLRLDKAEKPQVWVSQNCDSLKRLYKVPNIYYDLDKSFIRDDAKGPLNTLAELMKLHPEMSVITASHCDSRASSDYNKALSLRRGEAAKAYLVSRGVPVSRIRVEYYGKTRLINKCTEDTPCSEEEQQLNRRTEFDVIINGVNLSQMDCGGNK